MFKTVLTTAIMIALTTGCSAKEQDHLCHKGEGRTMHVMFQSVPSDKATLVQEGEEKIYCVNCGMDLPMFYKTNHAAKVANNQTQYCSIHCLAQDIMTEKNPQDIKVVDTNSLKFINAKDAYYVLDSQKKATMSGKSKYAFSTQKEAEDFAKVNGGTVGDFNAALALAKKDFSPMMREKMQAKKKMMAGKGAQVYKMKCKESNLPKFNSVASAKAYVTEHNLCKKIKGKALQALGIYLYTK